MKRHRNRPNPSSPVLPSRSPSAAPNHGEAASAELLELLVAGWLDFLAQARRAQAIECC